MLAAPRSSRDKSSTWYRSAAGSAMRTAPASVPEADLYAAMKNTRSACWTSRRGRVANEVNDILPAI